MENLMHSKVYVGTYAKYNNGSIKGDWIELNNFSSIEEFYEFCSELHSDETNPEFMFQDWENIPSELISESGISENIFSIIENGKISNVRMTYSNEERKEFYEEDEYEYCISKVRNALTGLQFDILKDKGKPISEDIYIEIWQEKNGKLEDWTR